MQKRETALFARDSRISSEAHISKIGLCPCLHRIDTCTLSAAQAQALAEIFMVEKGALEEIRYDMVDPQNALTFWL